MGEAVGAFGEDEEFFEEFDIFEEGVRAVGDDGLPVVLAGLVFVGDHELEVLRVLIGEDVEAVLDVGDAVLQVAFAGLEAAQLAEGIVGTEEVVLGADGLGGADDDPLFGFGPANEGAEGLVGFFVDHGVVLRGGADAVAHDFVGAQGFVFDRVEEVLPAGTPDGATGGVGDLIGQVLAREEVFDVDGVDAAADGVFAVGEVAVVVGDVEATDVVEVVGLGHFVDVEHQLGFGFVELAAQEAGVLVSGLELCLVFVAVFYVGDGAVVFLDAAFDFLKERFP